MLQYFYTSQNFEPMLHCVQIIGHIIQNLLNSLLKNTVCHTKTVQVFVLQLEYLARVQYITLASQTIFIMELAENFFH